nr:hypothetical protein [uncultured Actinomyces sp.]
MFTITSSKSQTKKLDEIIEILSDSSLLEFPNGTTIARYVTIRGAHACTVEYGDNLKLWLSDSFDEIADKYDFLTHSNLYTK